MGVSWVQLALKFTLQSKFSVPPFVLKSVSQPATHPSLFFFKASSLNLQIPIRPDWIYCFIRSISLKNTSHSAPKSLLKLMRDRVQLSLRRPIPGTTDYYRLNYSLLCFLTGSSENDKCCRVTPCLLLLSKILDFFFLNVVYRVSCLCVTAGLQKLRTLLSKALYPQ